MQIVRKRRFMKLLRTLVLLSLILTLSQTFYNLIPSIKASQSLALKMSKKFYNIRDTINIYGNVTYDGFLINESLVGFEIKAPIGLLCFRTVPTGNVSGIQWPVTVTVVPSDSLGNPQESFKVGTPTVSTTAYFNVTVKNNEPQAREIVVTITVYDGNGIVLPGTVPQTVPLSGNGEVGFIFEYPIFHWTYPGTAKACVNVYTALPSEGGIALCPETCATFQITGRAGVTTFTGGPNLNPSANPGHYNSTFRLSPEAIPGEYIIHATAYYNETTYSRTKRFTVEDASYPPQASFTYSPAEPYINQEITFDASGSSAEGYNDTIIRFEWNFGDGTPPVVKEGNWTNPPSPIAKHTYTIEGTYIVTLNVTDTEGLWSTTSKPVVIQGAVGPTADFVWSPPKPYPNQTVTFDASSSLPGWNGTSQTPIVSYQWNFGDGNETTTSDPVIHHVYTAEGNYTVILTVIDTQGLNDTIQYTVIVSSAPPLLGDVNGDCKVDAKDIALVISGFGTAEGDPNWNPNYDVYPDGKIDTKDIAVVIREYGNVCS